MGRLIPVPGPAGYGFPQFAVDSEELQASPPVSGGFTFWQYLLLSITAGVTTHYIIRGLEKKRR